MTVVQPDAPNAEQLVWEFLDVCEVSCPLSCMRVVQADDPNAAQLALGFFDVFLKTSTLFTSRLIFNNAVNSILKYPSCLMVIFVASVSASGWTWANYLLYLFIMNLLPPCGICLCYPGLSAHNLPRLSADSSWRQNTHQWWLLQLIVFRMWGLCCRVCTESLRVFLKRNL